ncbi:Reticulon-4-interacting protein 1, mitochondrial [Pseudolycoriella hygida]|uniref:Reticulon-4-interacting protein 1, mitochondrial n=1 Tax=Pseudolycoriella hygida TaxID=35572 RepID=A0A9Q0NDL4_9DIPT|nr:Reticulon-4-interacting protein 1, mitochondrial [Pseudolycoriella hygida]
MDELLLRTENALETLQVRLRMSTETFQMAVLEYTQDGRDIVQNFVSNNSTVDAVKVATANAYKTLIHSLQKVKGIVIQLSHPEIFFDELRVLFRDEIWQNNMFYVCVGLGLGVAGGFLLGMWYAKPKLAAPVMKSIACMYLNEPDNVTLCHTSIPTFIESTDILIRVRAVSIQRLDIRISNGYGKNFRRMIQNYNNDNSELPLVIGRACSGVVEGVGKGIKSSLEIGDEVWLASPWYETGLASEIVVAPECRVGRKPFIIGYEGAASLPYSGCVALHALESSGLNELNCIGKRVFIQNGCSPVGCVLAQLTKKWGAFVTSSCHIRSVPVIKALGKLRADDVIPIDYDNENAPSEQQIFFKELSIRKEYDLIYFTTETEYDKEFIRSFLSPSGLIIDTVEPSLKTDRSILSQFFYSIYVKLKLFSAKITKTRPNWDGPHLCHLALDRLASYVNLGVLQTVVDQVYTPQDAENAISHVNSQKSIGKT